MAVADETEVHLRMLSEYKADILGIRYAAAFYERKQPSLFRYFDFHHSFPAARPNVSIPATNLTIALENTVYLSGDVIKGKVRLEVISAFKCYGVHLHMFGAENTPYEMVYYYEYNETLAGTTGGPALLEFEPGVYEFSWPPVRLPLNVYSSHESKEIQIRSGVCAFLSMPNEPQPSYTRYLKVYHRELIYPVAPIVYKAQKKFLFDKADSRLSIEMTCFNQHCALGVLWPIELVIVNTSKIDVKKVRMRALNSSQVWKAAVDPSTGKKVHFAQKRNGKFHAILYFQLPETYTPSLIQTKEPYELTVDVCGCSARVPFVLHSSLPSSLFVERHKASEKERQATSSHAISKIEKEPIEMQPPANRRIRQQPETFHVQLQASSHKAVTPTQVEVGDEWEADLDIDFIGEEWENAQLRCKTTTAATTTRKPTM